MECEQVCRVIYWKLNELQCFKGLCCDSVRSEDLFDKTQVSNNKVDNDDSRKRGFHSSLVQVSVIKIISMCVCVFANFTSMIIIMDLPVF